MGGILFELFDDELNHRINERRLFALTREAIIAVRLFQVPFVPFVCVCLPFSGPLGL
jgi:hypothetical protein